MTAERERESHVWGREGGRVKGREGWLRRGWVERLREKSMGGGDEGGDTMLTLSLYNLLQFSF